MSDTNTDEIEDVESFRQRARVWLKQNMPRLPDGGFGMQGRGELSDEEELKEVQRNRELQRLLFDGGFTGIVIDKAYGGQGLTTAHHNAFNEEIVGYDYPSRIQIPNFTPCAAVILEFGTHEQKLRLIPPILKGEQIWMQFLSEPSGGSDVAGAQTSATRDGDTWLINGSKIWTTGAWWSDMGLCLARTNPDVPKHRGLSVFVLPIHQPNIELHRIEMLNGSKEFCQEFMTDVPVPDEDRIGDVDDGWTVGIRWMFYERSFALSNLVIRPGGNLMGGGRVAGGSPLVRLARKTGRIDDSRARDMIGEAHALSLAAGEVGKRIGQGMRTGRFNDQAASMSRLMNGVVGRRTTSIAWELAGRDAATWSEEDASLGQRGTGYLTRQTAEIAGGTTEMARNVVAERVLGMPRERTLDKDVPFRDVPKGPSHKK